VVSKFWEVNRETRTLNQVNVQPTEGMHEILWMPPHHRFDGCMQNEIMCARMPDRRLAVACAFGPDIIQSFQVTLPPPGELARDMAGELEPHERGFTVNDCDDMLHHIFPLTPRCAVLGYEAAVIFVVLNEKGEIIGFRKANSPTGMSVCGGVVSPYHGFDVLNMGGKSARIDYFLSSDAREERRKRREHVRVRVESTPSAVGSAIHRFSSCVAHLALFLDLLEFAMCATVCQQWRRDILCLDSFW